MNRPHPNAAHLVDCKAVSREWDARQVQMGLMAADLWSEILADVCMTSFAFHCCAGEPPLRALTCEPTVQQIITIIGTGYRGPRAYTLHTHA